MITLALVPNKTPSVLTHIERSGWLELLQYMNLSRGSYMSASTVPANGIDSVNTLYSRQGIEKPAAWSGLQTWPKRHYVFWFRDTIIWKAASSRTRNNPSMMVWQYTAVFLLQNTGEKICAFNIEESTALHEWRIIQTTSAQNTLMTTCDQY